MHTIAELARLTGQPYMTTYNQMKRGYCRWPKREIGIQASNLAYKCWENMIQRCNNPKTIGYHRYGGRGITLHPLFRNFKNFIAHIGPRPSMRHSIDRINNDGNYEPGNVRWASYIEQANNRPEYRRTNRDTRPYIEHHGRRFRFRRNNTYYSFPTLEEANLWIDVREDW